jgi:uncharacterized membrane protein YkgB
MKIAIAGIFAWISALNSRHTKPTASRHSMQTAPYCLSFMSIPEDYKAHLTHEGELRPEQRA